MLIKLFAVALFLSPAVWAGEPPIGIKYFSGRVSDVEYVSTNDCYVLRRNPAAKQFSYVYTSGVKEPIKLQPGETYVLARGKAARFTQHVGVSCTVTFTNGVSELNGDLLPAEFSDSERQLLVQGNYDVGYRDFKKYAFVVNAEGEGYDAGTKTKFHFGLPFHAPKVPPKLSRGMENIQRNYREEGVEAYKTVLDEPIVQTMKDSVKEGVTNAVSFVREMGGPSNISEKDKKYIIQLDPENAQLLAKMEACRWQETYVVFCTREESGARVVAVARFGDGPKCRMWSYECGRQIPSLRYSLNCQGRVGSYFEYDNDGLLRNLCLFEEERITAYYTIKDGVLQKSSDMQKAQEFIFRVEELFYRYEELDTSGSFKPFVEKLKAQTEEAKNKMKRQGGNRRRSLRENLRGHTF